MELFWLPIHQWQKRKGEVLAKLKFLDVAKAKENLIMAMNGCSYPITKPQISKSMFSFPNSLGD